MQDLDLQQRELLPDFTAFPFNPLGNPKEPKRRKYCLFLKKLQVVMPNQSCFDWSNCTRGSENLYFMDITLMAIIISIVTIWFVSIGIPVRCRPR